MSESNVPMLVNLALDLQITICTLLHPSDILALRRTCKTLQLATRSRIVWLVALHRVCFDNTLFLPSFPMSDMSDVELEQAALAPWMWIKLCAAFKKQHLDDSDAVLHPQTTRVIEDSLVVCSTTKLFIVPGGRYLVDCSRDGISVWDLGYTSNTNCKLIASLGMELGLCRVCIVQATPDGMGLAIFLSYAFKRCLVYEIYPQHEIPQLIQIAHFDFITTTHSDVHFLPGTVIWYRFFRDRFLFRVWDYRVNHSISFFGDDRSNFPNFQYNVEVIATKTAIIVLCEEAVLIWAIPLLLPGPPDFSDHNLIHIPPLFRIALSEGTVHHSGFIKWQTTSPWYFASSHPLYFDSLCWDSKCRRFQIIIKPDLSDASLEIINTSEFCLHDFHERIYQKHSICEDTLVSCWGDYANPSHYGADIGLTSPRFANLVSLANPADIVLLAATRGEYTGSYTGALCPASGRFVYLDCVINRIVVHDFF